MKKVLIYGFFGIENAGNEAMLSAFCSALKEAMASPVEFIVASRHPSAEYDRRYQVRTIPNFEYDSRDKASGRWLRGLNPDDSAEYLNFINEVAAADLAVIGPGQYLVETGENGLMKGALGQTLALATACSLTHTPLYGLALACEDLKSAWGRLAIQKILTGFADLTFRDPLSVDNLVAAGLTVPECAVLGDIALLGERTSDISARNLFDAEGIRIRQGPRLAMALRRIYWMGLDEEAHRDKMAEVIEQWLEFEDRDVILVSQNVYDVDGDRDDDRVEAEKTLARLPKDLASRVFLIRGKYDPAAIEGVYGLCDVTLSTRLHGAVFSCKQGTPPVMLTFMDKTTGFFTRLGHTDRMVPLDVGAIEIARQLEDTLARRSDLSKAILEDVERIRKTASGYIDRCVVLLEDQPQSKKNWAQSVLFSQ